MANYDEDVNENPFFRALKVEHPKLFEQCVTQKWLICVPRRDLVPKYAITMEDFLEHIVRPNDSSGDDQVLSRQPSHESLDAKEIEDSETSSTSDYSSGKPSSESTSEDMNGNGKISPWKFKTLSGIGCDYRPNQYLRIDRSWQKCGGPSDQCDCDARVKILFEETFYTEKKRKYKVVCIDSTLCCSSSNELPTNVDELWNLTSLRDCIDFLWMKGKLSLLESYDAYIKLFLHNHRTLDNLPVAIQRDVVLTLFQKCLNIAMTDPDLSQSNANTLEAIKVATETYVLNGVYRFLMGAITAALSYDDGFLNKVIRNLHEIKPQDLDIDPIHCDSLVKARQELGRLDVHTSPLGKLTCLKRTLRHLSKEHDTESSCSAMCADQLLPIWLYLVVKTPLSNWNAQLEYLKQFRFSTGQSNDSETSFLITTLEASLMHLKTGKILGIVSGEKDLDMPSDMGDTWFQALTHAYDEPSDVRVAEMFSAIKIGNLSRLQEVITEYEEARAKQNAPELPVDPNLLCHPLCACNKCISLTKPNMNAPVIPPVSEATNDDGLTLLHLACLYGRLKIVEFLISMKNPLDLADSQGLTALHHAACRGHQNALLLLLHAGAALNLRDKMLRTPLHLASQNGHEACVKALIYFAEHSQEVLNLSPQDVSGNTPLHEASKWGFHGVVQILVENGAAINIKNKHLSTPLDCAKDVQIVRILQRSVRRRSLVSASHGDFVNVEVLAKEEKDFSDGVVMLITEPQPNKKKLENKDQNPGRRQRSFSVITPPSFATSGPARVRGARNPARARRHTAIVAPTVENGLIIPENHPVNLGPDTFVVSNIDCAVEKRRISLDESARLRKVSTESLDNIGVSVPPELPASVGEKIKQEHQNRDMLKIVNAISAGDVQLALFYLGIPVSELSNMEMDPQRLDLTKNCHPLCPCQRCAAKSAGLGLDINMKHSNGQTALHCAIQYGITSLVKILYRYGADVNARTGDNLTPLQLARKLGHKELVNFLEQHQT